MLRNMLIVFVALVLVRCSTVHSETILPALQFGQTRDDYIQFPADFMGNSTLNQFSICTWVRKRYRGTPFPFLLDYHIEGKSGEIIMSDNGYHNSVNERSTDLTFKFNVPDGQWFHQCMTWSTADNTLRVYLNGEELAGFSVQTYSYSKLWSGGTMCLGNSARVKKSSRVIFGGDIYKLNMYGRVLEKSEIRILAFDICSSAEDRLAASMILKWGEIIKKERAGNVTEISTHCETEIANITIMVNTLADTNEELKTMKLELRETSNGLNSTKQELGDMIRDLRSSKQVLSETKEDINSVKNDLVNTRQESARRALLSEQQGDVIKKREKNERLYLILTIVFGTLSVVLMIVLTTLLVKRVYVNRTN